MFSNWEANFMTEYYGPTNAFYTSVCMNRCAMVTSWIVQAMKRPKRISIQRNSEH